MHLVDSYQRSILAAWRLDITRGGSRQMVDQIKKDLFTDKDALVLHQLRLIEWLSNSSRSNDVSAGANPTLFDDHRLVPAQWN